MAAAHNLRRKAEQALRLARQATDSLTCDRLVALAGDDAAQIAELERIDPDNRAAGAAAD